MGWGLFSVSAAPARVSGRNRASIGNVGVPQIRGTSLEVVILRTIVLSWGLYRGPCILRSYHI